MPETPSVPPPSSPKLASFARRLIKTSGVLTIAALTGLAALLAALWLEHRTETTLPEPTGHFAVGRTTYAWVNDAQVDELAPSPGVKRQVLVWIWYPAASSKPGTPADYLPADWRAAEARHTGVLMSQFLTRDLSRVRAHSWSDASVSLERHSYPVAIMRAGGGALTTDFTALAEDLASYGYVVVGFDAPHRTNIVVLPDGRVVERPPQYDPENVREQDHAVLIDKLLSMWNGDTQFVVDQLENLNAADASGRFTGRLDMQRLGMFGHSFGGATALEFCHDDPRCKAGIDIDGAPYGSVIKEGLKQPFLILLSDHGDLSKPDTREVFGNIRSIYDRLPNGRLLLTIRGANHFSFSDQILLKSQIVVKVVQFLQGGVGGRRGLEITRAYVHTFFDVYLKNAPGTLLDNLRRVYPEVSVPGR